ncbi:MAG: hypothetical protein ACPG51_03725 [Thiolinea sp.]
MAETPAALNTHTLYNYHARQLRQANEAIAQTDKYLNPDSPHYLPAYIEQMEALQNSEHPPENIEEKLTAQRANLIAYTRRAEEARQVIADYPAKIRELEAANDIYRSPQEKQDEYLYVMDEETCQASCVDWESVAGNAGQEITAEKPELYHFRNKEDIELSGEHETDALRVWNHNVCVENLTITDNRTYTDAHRDAIQLIPPPLHRFDDGVYVRLADQMAGAVLENVIVQDCKISAPNGPLQGIFASDGMYRNLQIHNNDIGTKGAHSISIAGLLSGGAISGNTLREVPDGDLPQITLYPARIGGNMADDGVVGILSFAQNSDTADQSMAYEPVSTEGEPNKLIRVDGSEQEIGVEDVRGILPDSYLKLAAGLTDFDYAAYLADYSTLTLGQYREHDPFGAQKMEQWLTLRKQEFAEGRAEGHPLGQPSDEQQMIGQRFLNPALQAMQEQSVEEVRLVDLEYTAIRSFAMKRLAIMHGQVEPMIDVALLNERRAAMLHFLLPPEQLENIVRIAHLDATMVCNGSGQAVPYLKFTLFFAPGKVYEGATDAAGKIAMSELPLGPYIMRPLNDDFVMAAKGSPATNPAETGTEAAGIVAQALLDDFSNKIPVVRAWLADDAGNEAVGLAAMRRHLSGLQVSVDTEITGDMRRDCLAALGLGVSRREPYRQDATIHVLCPQTNEQAGGCLFFLINLVKKLLGR